MGRGKLQRTTFKADNRFARPASSAVCSSKKTRRVDRVAIQRNDTKRERKRISPENRRDVPGSWMENLKMKSRTYLVALSFLRGVRLLRNGPNRTFCGKFEKKKKKRRTRKINAPGGQFQGKAIRPVRERGSRRSVERQILFYDLGKTP